MKYIYYVMISYDISCIDYEALIMERYERACSYAFTPCLDDEQT